MPPMVDFSDWMDEQSKPHILWYVKRLSGNDTLANGTHQAGPYIPKEILFDVFPSLNRPDQKNPDLQFDLMIDSHLDARKARAVWYNNKLHENPQGGRNETRVTGFGGQTSALLDPDSTGAIAIFCFRKETTSALGECHVWVCHATEEDLLEERIGSIEPGHYRTWSIDKSNTPRISAQMHASCWLESAEIPELWCTRFPTGGEIVAKTVELRPCRGLTVDARLIKRRDCEFEMFRSLEENIELPLIRQGFSSIEEFVSRAQTILQRRKARSGRSLELHTRAIFLEEQLREGIDFAHQPESDLGKRPDFLFPSQTAYRDSKFPDASLRMLAVKTTCKDRWRQILNEASRVKEKHLLTLQEGVSENQFREMTEARVKLVVPKSLISAYPVTVQPHVQTLESFIADVRLIGINR